MNILLIGEVFSENLGDRLVCEMTTYLTKKLIPEANICVLDLMERNQPSDVVNTRTHISETKQRIRALFRLCPPIDLIVSRRSARKKEQYYRKMIDKKIDLAVFTGGQLVGESFYAYIDTVSRLLEKENIPVVYNAVGIGQLSIISKHIFRKIFSRKNIVGISCRCNKERFCRTLNISSDLVQSTYDTAMLCSKLICEQTKQSDRKKYVGLGIMYCSHIERQKLIDFWCSIIAELESKGVAWKVFTTGCVVDDDLAKEVLVHNGYMLSEDHYMPRPISTTEMLENYRELDRIISFRLHSHIVAYSMGVPSIAIVWEKKVVDFFSKIDRNQYCFNLEEPISSIINSLLGDELKLNAHDDEMYESIRQRIVSVYSTFLNFVVKK